MFQSPVGASLADDPEGRQGRIGQGLILRLSLTYFIVPNLSFVSRGMLEFPWLPEEKLANPKQRSLTAGCGFP